MDARPHRRRRDAAIGAGMIAIVAAASALAAAPAPPPGPQPGGPGPVIGLPFPGPEAPLPPPRPPPPPVATQSPRPPPVPIATQPPLPAAAVQFRPEPPPPPRAPVFVGPAASASPAAAASRGRITEIIPPADDAAPWRSAAAARMAASASAPGTRESAAAEACVNVFVRSAQVDGRDAVSVDLHGDGLIKGAVPPPLAGELLARAGAAAPNGTRAACVPAALAQRLFDPVVNVAAVDPAVRMARDGDHWVLAGASVPAPAARAEAPMQLASATTNRGGAPKKAPRAKPRAPAPQLVAYWFYP